MSIIFFDVETVPMTESYDDVPKAFKKHWEHKYSLYCKDENTTIDEYFNEKAPVYAEFGEVACISVGTHTKKGFYVKSMCTHDEKYVLNWFNDILKNATYTKIAGHNILNFDIPFLCRRMIVNGIIPNETLIPSNFKKWDNPYIDTMDLWKFGQWQNYTSLDLLCTVLGIESPKQEMQGSDVQRVYYEEKDTNKIVRYCEGDVIALARCYARLKGDNHKFNILKK